MPAQGIGLAKMGNRCGHHRKRGITKRQTVRAIRQSPRHQAAIAPPGMGATETAHVVVGRMGFGQHASGNIRTQGWRRKGKPPCSGQKVVQHAAPHQVSPTPT